MTMLPQAVKVSKMPSSNTTRNSGVAKRILPRCLANHMHTALNANNMPGNNSQLDRLVRSIREYIIEERVAGATEKVTFVLPLPAETLAGEKRALVPGGSPEAVKVIAWLNVPFSADSIRVKFACEPAAKVWAGETAVTL